jgi:hypothetical protein
MDTDSKQAFGIKFGNDIYRHKYVALMKKNYVILCLLPIQPEHTIQTSADARTKIGCTYMTSQLF